MARNFDNETRRVWDRDHRTFTLRGEQFTALEAVRPEALAAYEDRLKAGDQTFTNLIATTDDVLLSLIEGGDYYTEEPGPDVDGPEIPDPDWARPENMDADQPVPTAPMIPGPKVPGPPLKVPVPGSARDRYFAVRALNENPVTLAELQGVIEWLFEVHAVRPTGPSGASSNGAGSTGASSTATSSASASPAEPTV